MKCTAVLYGAWTLETHSVSLTKFLSSTQQQRKEVKRGKTRFDWNDNEHSYRQTQSKTSQRAGIMRWRLTRDRLADCFGQLPDSCKQPLGSLCLPVRFYSVWWDLDWFWQAGLLKHNTVISPHVYNPPENRHHRLFICACCRQCYDAEDVIRDRGGENKIKANKKYSFH